MASSEQPLTLCIIIPAYNEEIHIKRCLDAIVAQTVIPDEVIVVDNNSSDKTAEIAKSYKFVTVIHEKEQGIVYARNAGFNRATADFICRIDADTVLPPNWLEYITRYYSHPTNEKSALTGRAYFTNVVFPPPAFWEFIDDIFVFHINKFIAGHYILWGSNMALPRRLWEEVRDDVCIDNGIHEDLDLAMHLHEKGVRITYRPKLIVGVEMKRVFDNWTAVYGNLMLWPRTFRKHHKKRWVVGAVGAYFLLFMSVILIITNKPILYFRQFSKNQ